MVLKSSDSSSKLKKSHGEQSSDGTGNLYFKMNQLKKQIQADRVVSIREKIENNGKALHNDVARLLMATRESASSSGQTGVSKLISLRIERPLCKYSGFAFGSGEKDYVSGHEVAPATNIKLPYAEKIPPYTTWIFLDRNQRMADDQSVVGRRRIYYDPHGSEALICSDSEDDIVEAEEEKHEFSEGEDRFLWMFCQEHGLAEEVLNSVSQFIEVTASEIEERYNILKEKYDKDHTVKVHKKSGSEKGLSLDKSLSAALDSFDNLFCRRCLVFDCRLHGCSQTLIHPSEKQSYWCEYEDDRKPCSNQCFLRMRVNKDLSEAPADSGLGTTNVASAVEKRSAVALDSEEPKDADVNAEVLLDENCLSEKGIAFLPRSLSDSTTAPKTSNPETSALVACGPEDKRKRKVSQSMDMTQDATNSIQIPVNVGDSFSKKQKLMDSDVVEETVKENLILAHCSSAKDAMTENEVSMSIKKTLEDSTGHSSKTVVSGAAEEIMKDDMKDVNKVSTQSQSYSTGERQQRVSTLSAWTPIEKELYLKGVEMFGKNSCLIARNLLSGLKTCKEVSNYMRGDSGAIIPHRSVASSSILNDSAQTDAEYGDQEMPTRSRLFRRRGRARKLKYSWKSAGHPSMWKRIADGKNQSCKQYTPCSCQSMCGKECSCLENGTCCEKYCGCSKSCKNRFRGCHCAKSQCRSRQCPCFAAGRECDPDVCRNCWVSCGDGSLGEPPRRGDGQCGNMRLLLRQQQRILLAKSDVAGWGAFLKNSVNKNEYLGEYTGELISHREADKRGKIYDRANSSFLFDLNDQYVLDAYRKGDKLKFANHSSNPNCYAKVMLVAGDHRVGIFAKEHIEASEELFYDYRYGPDQAPAWARRPEGSKRDDTAVSQGRAKKHQSH